MWNVEHDGIGWGGNGYADTSVGGNGLGFAMGTPKGSSDIK